MQSNNLTPPSSTSSSSSLSSLCSTGSIITNNSNKKSNYNNNSERHLPNSKRKLNGCYHSINNEQSMTNSATATTTKPLYSEYLNTKSILYVYFKGDVLNAIDDHFKKSFNLNKSTATNKKETIIKPNLSSTIYSSNNYYWSTTPILNNNNNNNNSSKVSNVASSLVASTAPANSLTNYLTPNFTNEYNQTSSNNEIWPYYHHQQTQFYDNNGYQNTNLYENCWNRCSVSNSANTNGFYNYNSYYDEQQQQHNQSKPTLANKSYKEVCIKEEPSQINNSFETNQMSTYSINNNFDTNSNYTYNNTTSTNTTNNNNRYSTQYFDISKQEQDLKSNKVNGNYLQYQGF